MSQDDRNREVAIHEAGHDIVRLELGWPIRYVTIYPAEPGLEEAVNHEEVGPLIPVPMEPTDPTLSEESKARGWALDWLVYNYAGILAEQLAGFEGDISNDSEAVDWVLGLLYASSPEEEMEIIEKVAAPRAEEILKSQWDRVEAIADALIEQWTLTQEQCEKVLSPDTAGRK